MRLAHAIFYFKFIDYCNILSAFTSEWKKKQIIEEQMNLKVFLC